MKYAKKMLFNPVNSSTDPKQILIIEFEKDIDAIFENKLLTFNDKLDLYKKRLQKFESLLLNSNEDEMEYDETKNEEIIYQLFDPSHFNQEGSTATSNFSGGNETTFGVPYTSKKSITSQRMSDKNKTAIKRKISDTFDTVHDDDANTNNSDDDEEMLANNENSNDDKMEYLDFVESDESNGNDEESMEFIEQSIKRQNENNIIFPASKKVRFDHSSKRLNDSSEYVSAKKIKTNNLNDNISNKRTFDHYNELDNLNGKKRKIVKPSDNNRERNLKRSNTEDGSNLNNRKRVKDENTERSLKRKSDYSFEGDEVIPFRRAKFDDNIKNNKRAASDDNKHLKKIKIEPSYGETNFKWSKYRMSNIQ